MGKGGTKYVADSLAARAGKGSHSGKQQKSTLDTLIASGVSGGCDMRWYRVILI